MRLLKFTRYLCLHLYNGCKNLQKLNISSFRDKGNLDITDMFIECPNLKEVRVNGNNIVTNEFEKILFMKL